MTAVHCAPFAPAIWACTFVLPWCVGPSRAAAAAPLGGSETSQARAAQGGGDDAAAFALSDDYGCDTDDEADGECSLGEDGEDEEAPPDDERWVPYRCRAGGRARGTLVFGMPRM